MKLEEIYRPFVDRVPSPGLRRQQRHSGYRKVRADPSPRFHLESEENPFKAYVASLQQSVARTRERRPSFFEQAEQLARVGRVDAALDRIYDGVDALMRAGELQFLENLIADADPHQSDIDLCIALLSASIPVRQALPVRALLYQSLLTRLTELGEDPASALAGLD